MSYYVIPSDPRNPGPRRYQVVTDAQPWARGTTPAVLAEVKTEVDALHFIRWLNGGSTELTLKQILE